MSINVLHTSEPTDDRPFDFAAWRARKAEERTARRLELETALAAGKVVRQRGTFWTVDACISTMHGHPSVFRCFVDHVQSDPAYLAEHIESREYGFGFATSILSTSTE